MYIVSAEYEQDGRVDRIVSNDDNKMYSMYHNNGDQTFDDVAISNSIGNLTLLMSGWGLKFVDFDNDGNLDLFLANGHPDDRIEERFQDVQYSEPMLLFRNRGSGCERAFEHVSGQAGSV